MSPQSWERRLSSGGRRCHPRRVAVRHQVQLPPDVSSVLPSLVRVLGQADPCDLVESVRRHGLQRGHGSWLDAHDGVNQTRLALARERLLARDHLVDHTPERPDVRPGIRLLAFQLLGGHVVECAQDRALVPSALSASFVDWSAEAVAPLVSLSFASPKSSSFAPDSSSGRYCPGFRSRCVIPCRCALSSASAIWMATCKA